MKLSQLEKLPFDMAASRLIDEGGNNITTLESLKDFIIYNVLHDSLYLAAHVLDAIRESDADFWDYDYCMGTLEKPTPIEDIEDLQDYCEDDTYKSYTVTAHINSLKGEMDEVLIVDEQPQPDRSVKYIAEYKGKRCSAIFNPFVCQFYVDDIYGVIKED